jgi:hypothetical protein
MTKIDMRQIIIPHGETIVAFLKSKGWRERVRDQFYCMLTPPQEMSLTAPFEYRIPLNEAVIDYQEYAIRQVSSIADLYQMDKSYLLELLSQSIADIEKDIVLRQQLVANAV